MSGRIFGAASTSTQRCGASRRVGYERSAACAMSFSSASASTPAYPAPTNTKPSSAGSSGMDRGALELQQDAVAERNRVSEVLEADPVFREPGHGKGTRRRPERDDETLVSDLDRSGQRLDGDGIAVAIVTRNRTEDELGVRAHFPKRNDHVTRLERPRGRLGEKRRVQHEVLERDDRRAMALQQSRDVAAGEAPAEDQGSAACFASLHGSCLPRWRIRSR